MRRVGTERLVAAVFLVVAASGPASAQDARLTNSVDTTLVTVGDRIRLTITVDHAAGARVVWPDSRDLSPFEVLAAESLPPATDGPRIRSGAVLTLAAFELGDLEIPSFEIQVVGPGEASETLATDRFGIEVVSVGVDEGGDIRGIRGPMRMPVSVITVSVWLILAVAIVVLAAWLYRRRKRRAPGEAGSETVPPRPPHEVALEALDRIEASPLLQQQRVKDYHIEVSEVLRAYVEARFFVPALEMTTREVMEGLHRAGAPGDFTDGLGRFLDTCDMVKFAKARPDGDASRAVLALGRSLVEDSIPASEPAAQDRPPEAENQPSDAANQPTASPPPTAGGVS
jgi:hypothetical protein